MFVLTLLALVVVAQRAGFPMEKAIWSTEATSLLYPYETRRLEIAAPDKRKFVVIKGVTMQVVMDGNPLSGIEDEGVGTLAELAWSPDSSAFFITESDGGLVGTWDTRVYLIEGNRVRRAYVSQEVAKRFKTTYKCREPEEPNIGGIRWIEGSQRLLLVAEVPPHSSCRDMGKIRGYIVRMPTGKITRELDEKTLVAQWGQWLGVRLKD